MDGKYKEADREREKFEFVLKCALSLSSGNVHTLAQV